MGLEQSVALVEAVLFLENEPVDASVLGRITGLNRGQVREVIEELRRRYA